MPPVRVERFLLGSVSAAVANRAECSVELVRSPLAGYSTNSRIFVDDGEKSAARDTQCITALRFAATLNRPANLHGTH